MDASRGIVVTPEQADILWEVRGVAGIDGVYAMPPSSGTRARLPSTVVVLERPDPYVLAVVTCALIRAIPDRDRFHVGVSTAPRFHSSFVDVPRIQLDTRDEGFARARATTRVLPPDVRVPDLPSADELSLELIWMIGTDRVYPLEVVVDPFRSLDPAMPILVTRAYLARDRKHAWQAESVVIALERLTWANPRWIACDEDLAIGEAGLLDALRRAHPEMLERTMVMATELSAEWMRKLIARRYDQVRVVVRSALFGLSE